MSKVNRKWNAKMRSTTDGLNVLQDDREYIGGLVGKTRRYDPFRGSSREYVWTDDAACNGIDPEQFEVTQEWDPAAEGRKALALRRYNEQKVADARKICESCPVRKTCLDKSEVSDRFWTVRGGLEPGYFTRPRSGAGIMGPSFNMKPWEPPFECKIHGRENVATRSAKGKGGNIEGKVYTYEYCASCNHRKRSK